MLWCGSDAMGEGLSRDLPGQVECCGLGSRERVSRYVDDKHKSKRWNGYARRDERKGYRVGPREEIHSR